MDTKQIQTTLKEIQQRLGNLERHMTPGQYAAPVLIDKQLKEIQRLDRDRRLQILRQTGRAWAHLKLDPIAWQRQIRKTWSARMKRQLP